MGGGEACTWGREGRGHLLTSGPGDLWEACWQGCALTETALDLPIGATLPRFTVQVAQ